MAQRRMFNNKITQSDAFLNMPLSAQVLYFHLGMSADDDGFVDNATRITRMLGCNPDDLTILIAKRFVIDFKEYGVLVIKHWRMNNIIKSDRYTPTNYLDVKSMMYLKKNGSYTLDQHQGSPLIDEKANGTKMEPKWNQNGSVGKVSIGKNSLVKDSIDNDNSLQSLSDKPMINLDIPTPVRSGDPAVAALTARLYEKGFLKHPDDDADVYRYHNLFSEFLKKYDIANVNQSVKYVLTFARPKEIDDKFNWFYTALLDNCEKYKNGAPA